MKKFLLVFAFWGAVSVSMAQQVDVSVAKKLAIQFMNARAQEKLLLQESETYSISNSEGAVYHVLNFYPTGYVIVSGEKSVVPVLAYSFTSNADKPWKNPSFDWWMRRYVNEITYIRVNDIKADDEVAQMWTDYLEGNIPQPKTQLEPLLSTTWNQGTYYNEFCPTDLNGPDDKCLTGCVATAIGQLMNYFRWPQNGNGFYTSEDTVYGTLSVDYSVAEYNFNEMAVDLNRSNPETAELIYNIGVSVDMHYGPSGSGMNNHKAAHCMKTFFRYVDSTQYIFRDSVNIDWDSVMVSHLDKKMPMYYAGWSDTNFVSGHAFVCDGYQDTSYFHFNWGWGGSYDGFFHVDNLSPGGANFTLMHELVINMYPEGTYPYYCSGTDTLKSLDGTIDDGSGPLFDYQNNTNCSWLIAPNDSIQKIKIEFLRLNTDTANDVITIYDGPDIASPILGTYSGNTLPALIESTGKSVFITFQSDAVNVADGFLLTYKAYTYSYCTPLLILTAESDTIEDGSDVYNYQSNVFCRWKIEPASGQALLLTFLNFDLDSTDYLRVIDHTNSQIVGEFRGNTMPPVCYSPNGTLTIYFKTSATAHADGFKSYYRTSMASVTEQMQSAYYLFPNPADNYFLIGGIVGQEKLQIFDTKGQLWKEFQIAESDEEYRVDISELSSGLYYVIIQNAESSYVFKLLK